jgi:hypothetical protein
MSIRWDAYPECCGGGLARLLDQVGEDAGVVLQQLVRVRALGHATLVQHCKSPQPKSGQSAITPGTPHPPQHSPMILSQSMMVFSLPSGKHTVSHHLLP